MADRGAIGIFCGLETPLALTNVPVILPPTTNFASNVGTDGLSSLPISNFSTVKTVTGVGDPTALLTYSSSTPTTQTYSVTGVVKTDNQVESGHILRMYRRDTGALLAQTTSDTQGSFTLTTSGYSGLVSVIAYDIAHTPMLNAIIYDLVTPI